VEGSRSRDSSGELVVRAKKTPSSPEITVVSPHLDDAIFSTGAFVSALSRIGTRVRILTVFGNDPSSTSLASAWDRRCGFATAGEAAIARRREDLRACGIVGAEARWLPFLDSENRVTFERQCVVAALHEHLTDGPVVAPMGPLIHPDHLLVVEMILEIVKPRSRVFGYLEQPYASQALWARWIHDRRGVAMLGRESYQLSTSPADWLRKYQAVSQYRSQLKSLSPLPRSRIFGFELFARGECIRCSV
jgi:LmbE family N-acetylglucosaminyl deacetylase